MKMVGRKYITFHFNYVLSCVLYKAISNFNKLSHSKYFPQQSFISFLFKDVIKTEKNKYELNKNFIAVFVKKEKKHVFKSR